MKGEEFIDFYLSSDLKEHLRNMCKLKRFFDLENEHNFWKLVKSDKFVYYGEVLDADPKLSKVVFNGFGLLVKNDEFFEGIFKKNLFHG